MRIPTSLPFVFAALKVASVLAMIGAVVGDYFGGDVNALGVQILSAVALVQYETAWAAILVASLIGLTFYGVVALARAPHAAVGSGNAQPTRMTRVGALAARSAATDQEEGPK